MSLCTEGDNNPPPNPPLTALLTQSIPHGARQVGVAKLPLPWQHWLLCCRDVSQVLSGGGGSDKHWPLLWIMSQTLLWRGVTVFCSRERAVRGHLPIILECVRETVSGQVGKKSFPLRITLYYLPFLSKHPLETSAVYLKSFVNWDKLYFPCNRLMWTP